MTKKLQFSLIYYFRKLLFEEVEIQEWRIEYMETQAYKYPSYPKRIENRRLKSYRNGLFINFIM